MCRTSMGGILSQCMCVSNHCIVHFKYIMILFVDFTSIKLGRKETNLGTGQVYREKQKLESRELLNCVSTIGFCEFSVNLSD